MATADDVETYRRHAVELVRYATVLVGPDDAPTSSPTPCSPRSPAGLAGRRQPAGVPLPGRAPPQRVAPPFQPAAAAREERAAALDRRRLPTSPPATVDAHRALASLSEQQRAVVFLTYWEDLSPAQVADLLGVSDGTVRKQLARAREHLRRILDA